MSLLLLLLASSSWCLAPAQCTNQWLPGSAYPGVGSQTFEMVRAVTMWDPDGAGPLSERVVVGGSFYTAGGRPAQHVAAFDPTTGLWSSLAGGMDADVFALAALPNGDLVAGGNFAMAGGVPAAFVARWNGTAWSAMGGGMNNSVLALVVLPSGDLVAGGDFTAAGGVAASRIARWDGASWQALGSGLSTPVRALSVLATGEPVAGGGFSGRVARWNGTNWLSFGSVLGTVYSLAVLANGDVVAGGSTTGGFSAFNGVARWNGVSWSALGSGLASSIPTQAAGCNALAALPGGDLVAGGYFRTAGGVTVNSIARWDGISWNSMAGGTNAMVYALSTMRNGDLVAGGQFWEAGGLGTPRVARWNGTSWSALSNGLDSEVVALAVLPDGDFVAGGWFTNAGGTLARRVARWDGTTWSALGSGVEGNGGSHVNALAVFPNGDLVVGGEFSVAGGSPAANIARWSGGAWSAMGSGFASAVQALLALPNGDVVAGGVFGLAKWNGVSWSLVGPVNGTVRALASLQNGDLVVGGRFSTAGGVAAANIVKWDGSSWFAMGAGTNHGTIMGLGVRALAVLPNGNVVAGGDFSLAGGVAANCVATWNGISWSAMGSGTNVGHLYSGVMALAVLPDGDLMAGGDFTAAGGSAANRIARWDGVSWSPVGVGLDDAVSAIAGPSNGSLAVGGPFVTAGGNQSANLALLGTTCPASTIDAGVGCVGPAGPLTLVARTAPWIGGSLHLAASNLAVPSLVFAVSGFTAASSGVPLINFFPTALPGCNLYPAADVSVTLLATSPPGSVSIVAPVPNSTFLIGFAFYHQMVAAEVDPVLGIRSVASTNALRITVGSF